ncbi:MAG: redoxin domain-containing protein [Haloferacaceae archaeon]
MIQEGDDAPDFTAPLATGDVEEFTLSDRLGEAPLVLAFFPAAFTGTCTNEMTEFQDRLDDFRAAGATVYGVSTDSPFALNEFRDKHGLAFDLVSDYDREVIDAYGVRTDFASMGLHGLARRSVFVVDGDGTVTYRWVADDPSIEPDYAAVEAAVSG